MTCCDDNSTLSRQPNLKVALVGNPNCGKTTLFNALTGAHQHVGNWPGVTVERKSGYFTLADQTVEVVDLPGVYSLTLADSNAVDERIACDFILTADVDLIINIVDASNLERHLYVTTQLIEMGVPFILAMNMMDVARSRQIVANLPKLSQLLGCEVVALEAKKGEGIMALKHLITHHHPGKVSPPLLPYPMPVQAAISALAAQLPGDGQQQRTWQAIRLLEGDCYVQRQMPQDLFKQVHRYQMTIQQAADEEADILMADARYRFLQEVVAQCMTIGDQKRTSWTACIDRIVLNRVLGIPIFLAMMYLLFVFAINIGGALQDFFDISSQAIFVDGFAYALNKIGSPSWLTAIMANGFGKGINTTITFIPVIGAMFLFLAFLEDSGYMARAAFVVDRLMRLLGLPGKAFVPMIVGFGCNVPAVMGARTLESKRDRVLTIMMSPFMSCGARLAIFAVFTAAFFPQGGQNIVFALYLIGMIMAVITGFILRKTLLQGEASPLVMELPVYHVPHLTTLLLHAWQRLKSFVVRAGRLIVPICIIIGALNTLNVDGTMNTGEGDAKSLLSAVGQWVTPIFAPMGIHADNWPATVGLVTGILAKEVVVGTLNTLYTQMGHVALAANAESWQFWASLQAAWQSIPDNFSQLSQAFSNPVLAKAPINAVNEGVYGLMYQKFDGKAGAFAYLLFILLYFPCISTTAAMLRELPRGWSLFSACWMTGVAYGTAVIFYQAATWARHPMVSLFWISAMTAVFLLTIFLINWYATHEGASNFYVVKA